MEGQTAAIVVGALSSIQALLLGIIAFFIKRFFDEDRAYREKAEKKFSDIKENYLERFENVNNRILQTEKNIIEVVTQLKYEHERKGS